MLSDRLPCSILTSKRNHFRGRTTRYTNDLFRSYLSIRIHWSQYDANSISYTLLYLLSKVSKIGEDNRHTQFYRRTNRDGSVF